MVIIQRGISSPDQGFISRPRLHALIDDGLTHSLLVFLAGPGYGKTQAMTSYLAQSEAGRIWIRLTGLDNINTHFWNHLVRALRPEHPDLADDLQSLGFPDTLSSFDAFIQLMVKSRIDQKRFIWVFDDFGFINNEQIKNFFRLFVDMELEQSPIVLISSELASTESIAFLSSKRKLVLAKDLRFTPDEISELYQVHGLPLEPNELDKVEQHTEGWALALHLLVQQGNRRPNTRLLDEIAITHIFEERFFSAYSRRQQLTLTRLGMLNHFTKELAIDLYDGNPVELEELGNHAFLTNEPLTGRLFLHHLYRLFLQKKQYLLSADDKRRTWETAAKHYAAAGETMAAISCYRKAEDRASMLKAIGNIAVKHKGTTKKEADFLLDHLDQLTPQELLQYPAADYFRAHICLHMLEVEKAESLLFNLEKRLQARARPDEAALLGDVYITLGFIHSMRNQEDYGEFFRKAAGYLPEGSALFNRQNLAIGNNHCFSMSDNQPGARERMEQAAYNAAPWINKVLRGCMSGMEHIISAESAYLICDFEKAQQQAYRGIYKAEPNGQHDYACNGYYVLARIGWLRGNLDEMSRAVRTIVEYTAKYKIAVLEDIRDTILAWYYLKLRDFNRIPRSIIAMDSLSRPLLANGRPQIIYGGYLIIQEEYAQLVGMLEHPQGLFLSDGIWQTAYTCFYCWPSLITAWATRKRP